ncbi:MAG TPA: chloride channel protein [Rhizomicrobium sp.]|jgi:CIC family chloride channel protein|nr:chloride channel protein [Rhizomicrobium sp.]
MESTERDSPRHALGEVLRMVLRSTRLFYAGLRRELRSNEVAQIFACALLGSLVGIVVAILRDLVQALHQVDFAITGGGLLSSATHVDPARVLVVPALGGLFFGALALFARRFGTRDIVDPIEANALYGGRMSLPDSLRLTASTVISNAAGASLGMEAGYTQLGSGLFSSIGTYFRLRRSDQRIFVTAGSAAAIAAAFNAPLAGAFYGYELILGSYMPSALAPVAVAAICGALSQHLISGAQPLFAVSGGVPLDVHSYLLFGIMGVFASIVAIAAMTGVTWTERTLRNLSIPDWLRPCVGGILLSAIAWFYPQVLGSGHGAIEFYLHNNVPLVALSLLLIAKLLASAISVGSGFRGGLFSSSLFLGCLFGGVFAKTVALIDPHYTIQYLAFLLVGMGAIAAGIIGAPLTMVLLVLESTGDFPITAGVLVSVIASATIVRLTFGYSFSTWRFHVRGLGLRGAYDIGWIADLTVSRMMRSDPQVVPTGMRLKDLRAKYPLGTAKRVYGVAPDGHYAGWVDMALVNDPQLNEAIEAGVVADLVHDKDHFLLPNENVRTALARFDEAQTEALPVLSAKADPRVIGYLTEAYALRRYTQELERRRSAELGERELFSVGQSPSV